jgi:transcriptional regulator with XRE-family HTH domain
MYMSSIGQNLKHARVQAGFTQKEVEAKLGLRDLSMKDFETERIKLPAEMAKTFADLFKVSVSVLVTGDESKSSTGQAKNLGQLGQLFSRGELGPIYLDPVIRAQIEEHTDKVFTHSIFELLTIEFTAHQKTRVAMEILKTLGSLMAADEKVSEEELSFLKDLIRNLELDPQSKPITKAITHQHYPSLEAFKQSSGLKHFMIWLMFLLSKSDGRVSHEEIGYIDKCAELLKINRSNYITIKNYFKGSF